jgi:hypothetical protein
VIGVKAEIVLRRFLTQLPQKFETAEGDVRPGPSAGTHAAPADSYLHQNDPATAPPAATQPGSTGYVAPAGQRDAGEQSGGRG